MSITNKKEDFQSSKPVKKKLGFSAEKALAFFEKRRNWVMMLIGIFLLFVFCRVVYEYFLIDAASAEFNLSEVKIKKVDLDSMEKQEEYKGILLAEKRQRIYKDLFR